MHVLSPLSTDGSPGYRTGLLTPETWDDLAGLVEVDNGVWGGCWCMVARAAVAAALAEIAAV